MYQKPTSYGRLGKYDLGDRSYHFLWLPAFAFAWTLIFGVPGESCWFHLGVAIEAGKTNG